MARFQAQTNAVLDAELEQLSEDFGLRANQRADLLREMATFTRWVLRQARAGRVVQARDGSTVEVFDHPMLGLVRDASPVHGLTLSDAEAQRLAEIMEEDFVMTKELEDSLKRLAAPDRTPPGLGWEQ